MLQTTKDIRDYLDTVQSNSGAGFSNDIQYRLGIIPGITNLTIQGSSSIVTTSEYTVAPNTHTLLLNISYLSVAANMYISSSSANDTLAGTGARVVLITGINSSGNTDTESISLTGQTPKVTVKQYKAINGVTVLSAGSTGSNEGFIYIHNNVGIVLGAPTITSTLYSSMEIGQNFSTTATYMVPAGYAFVPCYFSCSHDRAGATGMIKIYNYGVSASTGLRYKLSSFFVPFSNGGNQVELKSTIVFNSGGFLSYRAASDSATGALNVVLQGYLINKTTFPNISFA